MSTYENHGLEHSELPFIYRESYVYRRKGLFGSSNWHENIEILYITDGEGAVSDNAQILKVGRGDLVVINSNHLHALGAYDERLSYCYLIVDRSFCLSNGFDTNAITFDVRAEDDAVRELMEALSQAYRTESPYRTLTVRSLMLRVMERLCLYHSAPAESVERPERIVSCIKQAIDYIQASFDRNFSLDDVAQFVGLNKYYLSHAFRKYTGYSFVAYVNRTRCKRAQRLLAETDLGIGEIGRRCGFENRSYFAKCFEKYIGVLPGKYRERIPQGAFRQDC